MTPEMTPDLMYLTWTALLTAVLWIPYVIGQVVTNGPLSAENYRDPDPAARPVPPWVKRAYRAHLNAVECLIPFAVLILVGHVAGLSNESTAMWAMVFFWARVGHAVIFLLGIPLLRTLIFLVSFVAVLALFYELML